MVIPSLVTPDHILRMLQKLQTLLQDSRLARGCAAVGSNSSSGCAAAPPRDRGVAACAREATGVPLPSHFERTSSLSTWHPCQSVFPTDASRAKTQRQTTNDVTPHQLQLTEPPLGKTEMYSSPTNITHNRNNIGNTYDTDITSGVGAGKTLVSTRVTPSHVHEIKYLAYISSPCLPLLPTPPPCDEASHTYEAGIFDLYT